MGVSDTVIGFDYSGTLSLAMAQYGRRHILENALAINGLTDLGVTVDRYWQDIVEPTWKDTAIGRFSAKDAFSRRMGSMPWCRGDKKGDIGDAVAALLSSYFDAAVIEKAWKPLLSEMLGRSEMWVVVATDHYKESTAAVIHHLEQLGFPAEPIQTGQRKDSILVANSSDLGHTKRSPGFWQAMDRALGSGGDRALILVDDFRYHEPAAAPGVHTGIQQRCELMQHAAEKVFQEVVMIPFEVNLSLPDQWAAAIADVSHQVCAVADRYQSRRADRQSNDHQ